ncbi:MAG: abortive infection family protein [Desulfomonilaceae bacterium]
MNKQPALKSHAQLSQSIGPLLGSTKEMLESVMRTVVESFGMSADKKEMSDLLKLVQKNLDLKPSEVSPSAKGSETIKKTLSNLGQLVTGISELRNLYGTGHGKVRRTGVSSRHARLVVGAGTTLAAFIMETFEAREERSVE